MPHVIGALRYRFTALVAMTCCVILSSAYVLTLPSEYLASSKVYVDTENLVRPLLSGLTVNDDVLSDVQLMTRALKSRPQLEKLARQSDMDTTVTTSQDFEDLVDQLGNRIDINVDRQNVYTISYTDTNRGKALEVANHVLNNFVEDTLGSGIEDSKQAEEALQREIDDYERRLNEAEQKLKVFKQNNVGLMPDERGDYYNQLTDALASLDAAESELRMMNRRTRALRAQLEGEEPIFGIMSPQQNQAPSSFDLEISTLRQRIATLLVEYTDKHPEVVRARRSLDDLLVSRDEELAARPVRRDPTTGNLDLNPVYQSLRIQLNDAEVDADSMSAVVAERRSQVERLRELVDVVPEVEANLNRLNRDYEVVNGRYQEMLGRWEALQTSKRVKSGTQSVQFQIIEPTFAASDPAGPPRALFILMGLAFSIAVGGGLAVGLHFLNPAVHSVSHMTMMVGEMPVLGGISMALSDAASSRKHLRNLLMVVFACAVAVGTIGISVVAEPLAVAIQNPLALLD